jgi:AraC family transcriptional regulator
MSIEAMCRVINYIEGHLTDDVSVAQMADIAGYSVSYFSHCFRALTQFTPHDYLLRRRLSEAARALVESDVRVLEIALDYGFNNPETFSRAFKRVFGMKPHTWRLRGVLDPTHMLTPLSLDASSDDQRKR